MFNAETFIEETIASVLRQSYSRVQIVVVNDGSTDGSVEVVSQIARKNVGSIHLITQSNAGVSAARNHGVMRSSGDLVAFLDADDVWHPDKLARQVAALESDVRAIGAACGYEQFDSETGKLVGQRIPRWDERSIRRWLSLRGPGPLLPSTLLLRRQGWNAIGGFAEDLSTAADAEFGARLALHGSVLELPDLLVRYRQSPGQMHRDPIVLERDYAVLLNKPLMQENQRLASSTRANLALHLAYKRLLQGPSLLAAVRLLAVSGRHPVAATSRVLNRLWQR